MCPLYYHIILMSSLDYVIPRVPLMCAFETFRGTPIRKSYEVGPTLTNKMLQHVYHEETEKGF